MSDRVVHLDSDPHVAVRNLLPWYVTGRLEPAEHADVEAHLSVCPVCRSELEFEREWQAAVKTQASVAGDGDADAGWANMQMLVDADASTRIPASGAADVRRRPAAYRPMPWFLGGGAPARAWAVPALLSVALAVALVVTLRPAARVDDGYHALAAPMDESATAVVRFRPQATEAEIRLSLNQSGARLVDGPTVTNAYIVRLPRDRYAAALAVLRKQPAVTLVEALESAGAR